MDQTTNSPKLICSQSRSYSAHHMLLHVAKTALKDAEEKKRSGCQGWRHVGVLTAITFSALGIEAICNLVGDRIFGDWKDFENSSPLAKLRIITSQLGIEFDKNEEPWAFSVQLMKFRNMIAHPKPVELKSSFRMRGSDHTNNIPMPESKLEACLTIENADRAVKTVELIKEMLFKEIPPEKAFGLYADMGIIAISSDGSH